MRRPSPRTPPTKGQRVITAAISAVGADGFDAVISGDDAVATGVIAGLKAASIEPATRQVTGGDATIPGVQQVLIDQQLLTTFAPPTEEAQLAAVVACGLATGSGLPKSLTTTPVNNGTADIPSLLLTGVAVTTDGSIAGTRSVADTIVAQDAFGPDTTALICTADFETACTDAGISLGLTLPIPVRRCGFLASSFGAVLGSTVIGTEHGRPVDRAQPGRERRSRDRRTQPGRSVHRPVGLALQRLQVRHGVHVRVGAGHRHPADQPRSCPDSGAQAVVAIEVPREREAGSQQQDRVRAATLGVARDDRDGTIRERG